MMKTTTKGNEMAGMVKIELDVVTEDYPSTQDAIVDFERRTGATIKIVRDRTEWDWPVVELTIAEDRLVEALEELGFDADFAEDATPA